MGHCERLGLTGRAGRLAVLAGLLGLDALGSTADLTMGQAGQLVAMLCRVRDRAGLPGGAGDEGQGEARENGDDGQDHAGHGRKGDFISLAEAISRIMLMIAIAVDGKDGVAKSANVGLNVERFHARELFTCPSADSAPAREGDDPG